MLIGGTIGLILALGLFGGEADPGLCVVGLLFLGCLGAVATENTGPNIQHITETSIIDIYSWEGVVFSLLLIGIPALIFFFVVDKD